MDESYSDDNFVISVANESNMPTDNATTAFSAQMSPSPSAPPPAAPVVDFAPLIERYPGLRWLRDRRDSLDDTLSTLMTTVVHNLSQNERDKRLQWYSELFEFNHTHELPFNKRWPLVAKTPLCLYNLYSAVEANGGFQTCLRMGLMPVVVSMVFSSLPRSCTNAPFLLARAFRRTLSAFEYTQTTGRQPSQELLAAARLSSSIRGDELLPDPLPVEQPLPGVGGAAAGEGTSHLLPLHETTPVTALEGPKRGRKLKMAALAQRHVEHQPSAAIPPSLGGDSNGTYAIAQNVAGLEVPSTGRAVLCCKAQSYKAVLSGSMAPVLSSDIRCAPPLGEAAEATAAANSAAETLLPVARTAALLRSREPAELVLGSRHLAGLVMGLGSVHVQSGLASTWFEPPKTEAPQRTQPLKVWPNAPPTAHILFSTKQFNDYVGVRTSREVGDLSAATSLGHVSVNIADLPNITLAASGAVVWAAQTLGAAGAAPGAARAAPAPARAACAAATSLLAVISRIAILGGGGGADCEAAQHSLIAIMLADDGAALSAVLEGAANDIYECVMVCRISMQLFNSLDISSSSPRVSASLHKLIVTATQNAANPASSAVVAGVAALMLPPAFFSHQMAGEAATLLSRVLCACAPSAPSFARGVAATARLLHQHALPATVTKGDDLMAPQLRELVLRTRIAISVVGHSVRLCSVAPDEWRRTGGAFMDAFESYVVHSDDFISSLASSLGTSSLPPRLDGLVRLVMGQLSMDIARVIPIIGRENALAATPEELQSRIDQLLVNVRASSVNPQMAGIVNGVVHALRRDAEN